MTLRLASMGDAELLLRWRNDPKTREASLSVAEVSASEHASWLQRSLLTPGREVFIGMMDGKDVGTIRRDMHNGICELSWTIAPEARGRGLATKMVVLMATQTNGPLTAQIKAGNTTSVRVAEAAGMIFDHELDNILHYRKSTKAP